MPTATSKVPNLQINIMVNYFQTKHKQFPLSIIIIIIVSVKWMENGHTDSGVRL